MVQRTFIPGSEWLYFKIYTGYKTADEMLIRVIGSFVKDLFTRRCIDGFFFIRYSDPDFHIRFRLHIPSPDNYGLIMHEFHQRFCCEIETGNVVKIMCDTYVREIERYGAQTMELLEELFRIDSMTILDLLSRLANISGSERESAHWKISLLLLDDSLTAFGYDLPEKARITAQMAESFKKEFGFTTHAYTKQLNDKYRTQRDEIEQAVHSRKDFFEFEYTLEERRKGLRQIAQNIASVSKSGGAVVIDNLLSSIQHMTMNRWFRSRNRQHELIIYDFLSKYYISALAQNRMK